MTNDQLIGVRFHAQKIVEATLALHVLEEISAGNIDAIYLRGFHLKELRRNIAGLTSELGYRLVPVSNAESEEAA